MNESQEIGKTVRMQDHRDAGIRTGKIQDRNDGD